MSLQSKVIVSLTSFGAAEVLRHGQRWFIDLCREAGADGVEVRGELIAHPAREVPELTEALARTGMAAVYSSPEGLWKASGELDGGALERGLTCAEMLGVHTLKMSIGGFTGASHDTLGRLGDRLAATRVRLLIENDQTAAAGSIRALVRFFEASHVAGLDLGMTFDMGNWHWVGECPMQAAQIFAPQVRYVHCKGVQRQPHRWVAVPLQDSAAPWRTVLDTMPADAPRAIEYPLMGDDLPAVTRKAIVDLRETGATA